MFVDRWCLWVFLVGGGGCLKLVLMCYGFVYCFSVCFGKDYGVSVLLDSKILFLKGDGV